MMVTFFFYSDSYGQDGMIFGVEKLLEELITTIIDLKSVSRYYYTDEFMTMIHPKIGIHFQNIINFTTV